MMSWIVLAGGKGSWADQLTYEPKIEGSNLADADNGRNLQK